MYTGKYLSLERSGIIGKSRDYNDYCCLCKDFVSQTKLLRTENEKLLSEAEANKEQNKFVAANLKKETEKSQKYEREVKSLKAKLSEETALALTLQEENKKLKKTLECVSKEKADLVSQMMKATGVSDMVEEKK